MHVASVILGIALLTQPAPKATEPRLNVRAERGLGGLQSDGWQHIALRLENSSGQPIAGHATLYEWESQVGARPRIVLPFTVSDRQVVHFYPFRPPETPQPSSYVITLEDDAGRPIAFDGGSQIVIGGRSMRAIRVDMGSAPTGEFRVAIWGDSSPFLRSLVNEWTPSFDDIYRGGRAAASAQWQKLARSSGRISSEAIALEDSRMFPDSYVGYSDLHMLVAVGVDFDSQQLTERQRRALDDWVNSGGTLLFLPRKQQHLTGPFLRDLIGIQSRGEVTTAGDRHLRLASDAGPPHQIVHFLTALEPPRPIDVMASYETQPVVFSVAAGYGRVWIVAFDPDAHGGLRRYKPIWTDILNQTVKRELTEGLAPTSLASQTWSPDSDRKWLATLSERFGKSPAVEQLAILILCYLLVIGPANFFVLKRREARVWLIGTVPILAAIFGGVVLSMGYWSHGVRAATNYLALTVLTPEGDRAFAEEYVAVYGTTSAEYQLEFPRHLPVRPLSEYVANPNGGFENPSSFKLQAREDRQRLSDWRLTFWQTRGTASLDCTACGGQLTARRSGNEITIANETEIVFENVLVISDGEHPLGTIKPFETVTVVVSKVGLEESSDETAGEPLTDRSAKHAASSQRTVLTRLATEFTGGNAPEPVDSAAHSVTGPEGVAWPNDESQALLEAASNRVRPRGGDWVFGLSRQPVHAVRSPNTARQLIATVYAWPIVSPGTSSSSLPRSR